MKDILHIACPFTQRTTNINQLIPIGMNFCTKYSSTLWSQSTTRNCSHHWCWGLQGNKRNAHLISIVSHPFAESLTLHSDAKWPLKLLNVFRGIIQLSRTFFFVYISFKFYNHNCPGQGHEHEHLHKRWTRYSIWRQSKY